MRPSMRGNLVSLVVDELDTINAFLVVYATVCVNVSYHLLDQFFPNYLQLFPSIKETGKEIVVVRVRTKYQGWTRHTEKESTQSVIYL